MTDLIREIHLKGSLFSEEIFKTRHIERIERINPLPFPGMNEPYSTTKPIVLVIVEARLFTDLSFAQETTADLEDRLRRFHTDLMSEGYDVRSFSFGMIRRPGHQDGQGVLALRSIFQQLYEIRPNFAGAILVGSFPEAMLVRRWIWKKTDQNIVIAGNMHNNSDLLQIVPEVIAERSDIVLTDLSGNWDQLYERGPMQLDSIRAVPVGSTKNWPVDGGLFTSSSFEHTTITFEDFFFIRDDNFEIIQNQNNNNLVLRLRTADLNPECTESDKKQPNPIAQPDISVSRINPRNIAVTPDPDLIDSNGKRFLDESGKPQEVKLNFPTFDSYNFWQPNAALERQLLIDYFDRNHLFRTGGSHNSFFRVGTISSSAFNSKWYSATGMASSLAETNPLLEPPLVCDQADLLDFVKWIKKPAIMRSIATHANHQGTIFDKGTYSVNDLEDKIGGPIWRWCITEFGPTITYTPSLIGHNDIADFYVYRSLWENKTLADASPSFFLHNGCHVNSPVGSRLNSYDSTHYAPRQEAESLLFYLNGLAVVSRAKEFNDLITPHFPKGFGLPDSCFGSGLTAYFQIDGKDTDLGRFENRVKSKRTYTWSILGDWTLRLAYNAVPIAILRVPEAVVWPLAKDKWLVTDGFEIIKTLSKRQQAERVAQVINHFGLTERYIVGDATSGWEYYLSKGNPPRAEIPYDIGDQIIEFEPENLVITTERGSWTVTVGSETIARFPNKRDADTLVAILQHHHAIAIFRVGDREDPAMTFFISPVR